MTKDDILKLHVEPPYFLGVNCFRKRLTLNGTGVNEIDAVLQSQWQYSNRSPESIVTSAFMLSELGNLFAQLSTTARYGMSYSNPVGEGSNEFLGRGALGSYINKFAMTLAPGHTNVVELWTHPRCPVDAILFFDKGATYPEIALIDVGFEQ